MVKSPPANAETRVGSLGGEDPLEMATHSSILDWEVPRTEEPGTTARGVSKSQTRRSSSRKKRNVS